MTNTPSSPNDASWSYDTAAVQSGIPRGLGETIGFPIHAAAAFQFDTLEQAQDEFQYNGGLSYARIQNPTVRALEERLTVLPPNRLALDTTWSPARHTLRMAAAPGC